MDGGQAASNNSRRSQSPTTQALDSHFRTTMNGMATSVDVACDSLRELADEVLQRLTGNLGDNERKLVGQLQVKMFQESGKKADTTVCIADSPRRRCFSSHLRPLLTRGRNTPQPRSGDTFLRGAHPPVARHPLPQLPRLKTAILAMWQPAASTVHTASELFSD